MVEPLRFDEPVIFVGGSSVNWKHLKSRDNHPIIAVDGGGNDLFFHGLNPNYLVGDFDSITPKSKARLEREGVELIALDDQNQTDFAKALDLIDAPVIYAYGFMEGRMDHALAAFAQLGEHSDRRISLIGETDIAFLYPPRGEMSLQKGTRISFWSAGEAQIQSSHGLRWPLDGMVLSAANMSISNEMADDILRVDYAGDGLVAIVPVDAMQI